LLLLELRLRLSSRSIVGGSGEPSWLEWRWEEVLLLRRCCEWLRTLLLMLAASVEVSNCSVQLATKVLCEEDDEGEGAGSAEDEDEEEDGYIASPSRRWRLALPSRGRRPSLSVPVAEPCE
jgi:hypothetical protein